MMKAESFSKDWILKQRKKYPQADPQLIERQIFAFELVGLLVGTKKLFVFKSGTALLPLYGAVRVNMSFGHLVQQYEVIK